MKKIFIIIGTIISIINLGISIPLSTIPTQSLPISGDRHVLLDFDLDGDLDVAFVEPSGSIAWGFLLENENGNYTINTFWGFGNPGDGANAIASGDIDNNGFPDLAINKKNDELIIILNQFGSFNVNNPSAVVSNNSTVEDVLFADFDNDYKLDLAIARYSNSSIIFKGNGDGTFDQGTFVLIPGTNYTKDIEAADINADGLLDLICANAYEGPGTGTNKIYYLDKFGLISGILRDPLIYDTDCCAVGDIDNNGYFDILFGGNVGSTGNTNRIYMLTNSGSGLSYKGYIEKITDDNDADKYSPNYIDLADFNRDNRVDMTVAFGNDYDVEILIYTNRGDQFFQVNGFSVSAGRMDPGFYDVDNDGDLDFFSGLIYENTSPLFSSTPAISVRNEDSEVKEMLSFTENNVILRYSDQILIGYADIRNARFYTNYLLSFPHRLTSMAVGDVNGVLSFEDMDDFVIAATNGWMYVFTNSTPQSAGSSDPFTFDLSWSNKILYNTNGYEVSGMAIGDVSGDGAPDIVYSHRSRNGGGGGGTDTNEGTSILHNIYSSNGVSFVTNPVPRLPGMVFIGTVLYINAGKILIEDIDQDGDNDILGFSGGPDWIAYNQGQGLFSELNSQYPEVDDSQSGDVGDVDNDGDLDVVCGNKAMNTKVYPNNHGVITPSAVWQSINLDRASSVKFCDVDNDGDIDLGVANDNESMYSYIMRNNAGQLGTTENDIIWKNDSDTITDSGLLLHDFDNDNDVDIFLAGGENDGSSTEYSNRVYEGNYGDRYWAQMRNVLNTPAFFSTLGTTNSGPVNSLNNLVFRYLCRDLEGRTNRDVLVRFQVSMLDGTAWKDASVTAIGGDFIQGPLPSSFYAKASPEGYTNKYIRWRALDDGLQGSRFIMRTIVYPNYQKVGKVRHAAMNYYMKANFYINGNPSAFIVSPKHNSEVSGIVNIYGAAFDYDFAWYSIKIRNLSNLELVMDYTNTSPVPPVGILKQWDTTGLPSANYSITLRVKDNLYPNPITKVRIVELVGVNSSAPTVVRTYPASEETEVSVNSPVIAQFSDFMNVNTLRDGTMSINIETNELEGNVKYKNLVKCLIFEPTDDLLPNSTHVPQIQSSFKDVLGNELGKDYIWNFSTEKGLPESITKHVPFGEDVGTNTSIIITYDIDMISYTNFNDDNLYVRDLAGNKVSCSNLLYNPTNKKLVFTPDKGLSGSTVYLVTIKKDIINEPVAYPYTWYFITEDTVTPQVVSTSPANGSDFFDPTSTITIQFNKTMNVNMLQEGIFQLMKGSTAVDGDLIYDMQDNTLVFQPKEELQGLVNYTATVFSKFEDMGGQSLAGNYSFSFRSTKLIDSKGGILTNSDGTIRLRIPKNALTTPTAISISKLDTGDIPASSDPNVKSINTAYLFEPAGLKFNKAVTISLGYLDNNNNGIVENPDTSSDFSPARKEDKLGLFYYNSSQSKYERIGGTVDTALNKVTATIKHFSIFGLMEDSNVYNDDLEITEINSYPRVFSPKDDDTVDISFNVKFKQQGTASIKIYNLAGRLVKEVAKDIDMKYGLNVVQWDGKDQDGDIVHNRMYVILINAEDASGETVNKTKTLVVLD